MSCPELRAAWQRTTGGPAAHQCGPFLRHVSECAACNAFFAHTRALRKQLRALGTEQPDLMPVDLARSILRSLAAAGRGVAS